jgi:hypothetical protein
MNSTIIIAVWGDRIVFFLGGRLCRELTLGKDKEVAKTSGKMSHCGPIAVC